ncbi:MAG: hypothetical protein M3134_08210 [Actinomycetota bacterium]|nr:hypothetical protein [Actinomycetota bacterium]
MKVVIVVLIVVLVLFVVALGVGFGQDRGDGDVGRKGIAAWLADAFLRPVPPVTPEELSGNCVQGSALVLAPGEACTVKVAESSKFSRELRLVATAGAAQLSVVREGAIDVQAEVAPGDDAEAAFDLGRDEATLTVTCTFEACSLEIAS